MDPTNRKTAIALGAIALCAGPLIWLLKDVKGPPAEITPQGSVATGGTSTASPTQPRPAPSAPTELSVAETPAVPSLIADVRNPAKVLEALGHNAWIHEVLDQPLGRGFVGPWAGFWGTHGEDIAASFKGEVLDFVAGQVLAAPVRLLWFENGDSGGPALLEPQAPTTADAAFDALTKAAGHGVQIAKSCPGEATPDGGPPTRPPMEIQRWVIANQALYASKDAGRIAIARSPGTVVSALCAKLAAPAAAPGGDVELTLATAGLGHEAQVLTALLGLGPDPRLDFDLEGDRLVPRGIAGELATPDRVAVAPLSDALLKSVPVEAPVLFTAQLRLPESLDAPSLSAFFAKKSAGSLARQVAVVWVPHGDPKAPTEVAVLWSRTADGPQLDQAFAGNNPMLRATACDQLVYASTQALLDRIQRTCSGATPSLANAAGPIVAGLKQPASVGLELALGALLSSITLDAWKAEASQSGHGEQVPNEIAGARRELEALPTLGLTGTARGATLVGQGFHS